MEKTLEKSQRQALFSRFNSIVNLANKPDEKLLFAKLVDQVYLCKKNSKPYFSEFIDPARASLYMDIIAGGTQGADLGIEIKAFGGYNVCERVMLGIAPKSFELSESEFPIDAVAIKHSRLSTAPSHGAILGATLGLGIERGEIGDILLNADGAIMFLSQKISDFVCSTLEKAGQTPVKLTKLKELPSELEGDRDGQKMSINIASNRLDAVISRAFCLPRSKSAILIKQGRAFINWQVELSISKPIKPGDLISLRGYGRVKVDEQVGVSKKGRPFIDVTIWKR